MKSTAKFVAGSFVGLCLIMSSTLYAQDAQKGMGMNMPTFADFDLNGDGSITEDEFNTARAERIARHAQEGRQMKNMASAPSFADIDTDDDGSVSSEEFSAHQAEHMKKMTDTKLDQQQ
ncbi:MAG: EF-hand domain-containing protein [Gammaproteobacteria bacterium]|nr:EF-hand domain-containing protein [Gammaproteobacteria bacterium]